MGLKSQGIHPSGASKAKACGGESITEGSWVLAQGANSEVGSRTMQRLGGVSHDLGRAPRVGMAHDSGGIGPWLESNGEAQVEMAWTGGPGTTRQGLGARVSGPRNPGALRGRGRPGTGEGRGGEGDRQCQEAGGLCEIEAGLRRGASPEVSFLFSLLPFREAPTGFPDGARVGAEIR